MAPPFIPLTRNEFTQAVQEFSWPTPKTEIHVHHTWRPNHAQYRGLPTIQAMFEFHTHDNGWSDIAQHVSVGPEGTIWTGRPWGASPASASGHNGAHVFMFETIGDFDAGQDPLTGEQLDSVLHIVATIQIRFGLETDSSIRFHNQMSSKTCPGSSVDRSGFVAMVAAKRAELEALSPEARIVQGGSTRETGAFAARIMAAVGAAAPAGDDGDAEHDHSPALAAFMAARAQNPFLAAAGPAGEAAGADRLASADDEALFVELGRRAMAIEADPSHAGDLALAAPDSPEAWTPAFSARGRRLFSRIERELRGLMCGESGADAADRARLREAFGLGDEAVAAALVGALTGVLGLAPAVAAVAAALLMRLVVRPLHSETCAFWAQRLGDDASPANN